MNGSVAKEVVRAEEPGTEFRSIWTDLRHVPFQQGWLDVKGCRIRYLRSGPSEAPKVIMLAGTGGHAETFVANLGALGKQYDCWPSTSRAAAIATSRRAHMTASTPR